MMKAGNFPTGFSTNGRSNGRGRDGSGGLDRSKYLTTLEVTKLRRAVKDRALADLAEGRSTWVKNWMLIDLGLQTGLRVAELAVVKVEDIDLKGGTLTVQAGKGAFRDRRKLNATVPLGDSGLKRHIRDYIAALDLKPGDSFFGVGLSALQKAFKRCVRVARLDPRYSIHCLRHTLGTVHYAKNRNLRATQKLLRHASISTTTIYADVMEEEMRESVKGLYED